MGRFLLNAKGFRLWVYVQLHVMWRLKLGRRLEANINIFCFEADESSTLRTIPLCSFLISSSYLNYSLPKSSFLHGLNRNPICISFLLHVCEILCTFLPPWLDNFYKIWTGIQIVKCLFMNFSSSFCYVHLVAPDTLFSNALSFPIQIHTISILYNPSIRITDNGEVTQLPV